MASPDRIPEGPIKLGYEDYECLPADGRRYEILDGEMAVTPAPTPTHQRTSRELQWLLHGHVRANRLGEVFDAPIDVILSDDTIVQPDLLFLRAERLDLISGRGIEGAPDLLVEILSPSSKRQDRIVKAALYARHGVAQYWIVDPAERSMEIHELEAGTYRLVGRGTNADSLSPSLFPGLVLPLAEIWA